MPSPELLTYIVLDELESEHAGLSAYSWPYIDEWGRVRFRLTEEPLVVGVPKLALQRFLWRYRWPRRGSRRALRIGDVFAAETTGSPSSAIIEPAVWLIPPVLDITADARDAAKAAFFAAVAPTLNPERDREIVSLAQSVTPPEPEPPLET